MANKALTATEIKKILGSYYTGLHSTEIKESMLDMISEIGPEFKTDLPDDDYHMAGCQFVVRDGTGCFVGADVDSDDWHIAFVGWHQNWIKTNYGFRPKAGILWKLDSVSIKNLIHPDKVWPDQIDKVRNFLKDRGYLPA